MPSTESTAGNRNNFAQQRWLNFVEQELRRNQRNYVTLTAPVNLSTIGADRAARNLYQLNQEITHYHSGLARPRVWIDEPVDWRTGPRPVESSPPDYTPLKNLVSCISAALDLHQKRITCQITLQV